MRVLRPRYRAAGGGDLVDSPLAATGPVPVVDIVALAALFTGPAVTGEFVPGALWRGVDLVWDRPAPRPAGEPLAEVFAAAVAELCADAGTVAVKLSGGLDSLAVLVHVAALRPVRRLVAYCTDLVDDAGVSAAAVVRGLLDVLALDVELVVVDPARCTAAPAWSPHGPRPDALPTVNATVAELAARAGVEVLLSGDGADELLAVPRFATGPIARAGGVRAAARYAADSSRAGPGLAGELLALVAGPLSATTRARWYWAANWPAWCVPTIADVVAEPLRPAALAWADWWISATIAGHAAAGGTWAAADAADAFWPRAYTPPAGAVREASPFLHEDLVAAALSLRLADRYDAAAASAYLRCKAAVVNLFPAAMRPALPRRKQFFTRALAGAVAEPLDVPLAAATGLLDPQAVAACTDTAVRMSAAAVEAWLAGAVAAGAVVNRHQRDRL